MLQNGLHITNLESWDELDSVLWTVTAYIYCLLIFDTVYFRR
jgi:hypothetical protein